MPAVAQCPVDLDFDQWSRLASTDPVAFERCRRELVERFIEDAPARHRLRLQRLQWRIDAERRRHQNPMGACVAVSRMMLDSVYGPHGLACALTALVRGYPDRTVAAPAAVLPFPDKPRRGSA